MRFYLNVVAAGAISFHAAVVCGAGQEALPEIYNTQEESIPLLEPEEALRRMKLPPGFQATLFAGEPDVHQPIAMAFDARGRLWVAENYTYSEAEINFDTELSDRITIFEDADGDGRFDQRTVFWDEAKKLTSIAVGFGGVFATCPPHLLFIPDEDGNDVPDGPPEVLLDGFDHDQIRHTLANGLKFGPDGWLYGRHGIQATSWVGKPGATREERTAMNAAIWRFHPTKREFEVVAQGTTNPWGSDWDEYGEMFFINTVIGHLWHVVPGAYYKRMYGEPFNPYVYEEIGQTADHVHWDTREAWHDINKGTSSSTSAAGGGHAHTGLMMYLGDNWPEEYRNSMFTLNYHGKRINHDRIQREGAGYVGRHAPDFMSIDDPWFRGIELLNGPEGAVYVADWSDIGECHDNNGIHRTSGRIYRISHGDPRVRPRADLGSLENAELVRLQTDRNDWHVRQARQVLQERAARGDSMEAVHSELLQMFRQSGEPARKLRALWALYVTGGTTIDFLHELLQEEDEHLRVWGIRLLVDQEAPSAATVARFITMAGEDQSGLVLTYLASALQRIPVDQRWPLATALAERGEFEGDRVLPLMVWYGIEPSVSKAPERAAGLVEKSTLGRVREFATRRVFQELEANLRAADRIVQLLGRPSAGAARINILHGIRDALEGIRSPRPPASWGKIAPGLIESPDENIRSTARELDALFGNSGSQAALAAILSDRGADDRIRSRALEVLVRTRASGLSARIVALLDEASMAGPAIRALAALGERGTTEILLGKFEDLPSSARSEAINALISRPASAAALLEAVQRGKIPRGAIGASAFRQLREYDDAVIRSRIPAIWPRSEEAPESARQLFARYQALLTPERLKEADLSNGRAVYQQACASCHKLYGEGAEIGPELTGSDRHNLDYLLENILTPSGIVPEAYRASTVTLKDERVLNGIISGKTDQVLTLQTISEKLTLPAREVEAIEESKLSMMPDGLLDGLSEEQVVELVAYLMSSNPAPAQ